MVTAMIIRLVVAFHNLLDNALKFGGGGQVEVGAAEDGGMVVVEVADTGLGIPPEDIPYLFDELYRGQNARGVEGSGLGLALVQRIVQLPGRGTRAQPHGPGHGVPDPAAPGTARLMFQIGYTEFLICYNAIHGGTGSMVE